MIINVDKTKAMIIHPANLTSTEYKRLDKIMEKLANIILKKSHTDRQETMLNKFEKLNWLSSAERYELYGLEFVFKHIINETSATRCFQSFKKRQQSQRESRQDNNLLLPLLRTKYGQQAFHYQMTTTWNKLPTQIKNCVSETKFDIELRKLFLSLRQEPNIYSTTRIIH
jgi:hypothetical protein